MSPSSPLLGRHSFGRIGRELLAILESTPWQKSIFKAFEDPGYAFGASCGVRRSRNEDRIVIASVTAANRQEFALAIVCDGVGGSEMGDVAANLAIASIVDDISSEKLIISLPDLLRKLIYKADSLVQSALGGRGMTTLSLIVVTPDGAVAAANVGDSRIYAWDPDNFQLTQVSIDDTMENELRGYSMKDDSVLAAHGLKGRLSQAIGESGRLSSDLRVVIHGGECFPAGAILATDGAWKSNHDGFKGVAINAGHANEVVRRTLALSSWLGGHDNASVVAIKNIRKFSRLDKGPAYDNQAEKTVTVMIGETRLVMFVPHFETQPSAIKEKPLKQKKKSPPRGGGDQRVAKQLDLDVGSSSSGKLGKDRPIVEISTDDADSPSQK